MMKVNFRGMVTVVTSATALWAGHARGQATVALPGMRAPAESTTVAAGNLPDAQTQALVKQAYAGVVGSIVCIRTVVERELSMVVPTTGMMGMIKSPLALHGTGVVVDSTVEEGRTEYLILTNDHVANPSLYFDVHGRFLTQLKQSATSSDVEEKRYVVDSSNDDDASDDIELRVVARNPAGDVALLKTVHSTRRLTVFRGKIGYGADEVQPGALIITSGFPYGDRLNTAFGRVLDEHFEHKLGIPHVDYTVDTPLEPGQSGSPVFMVNLGHAGIVPEVRFSLIGLLHARESGTHLMVPYSLWSSILERLPSRVAAEALPGSGR